MSSDDITVRATALDGIAKSYSEEKNFTQARQKFAEIIALNIKKAPEFNRSSLEMLQAGAQIEIAKTYVAEGDKKQARAEFTKVLTMPAAKFFAEQVKSELEKLDKKIELAP